MENDDVMFFTREVLQPFFDELVETLGSMFYSIEKTLPSTMPIEEKSSIVKGMIEKQRDILIESFKSGIPKDFDSKLKEAAGGGK